MVLMPFKLSRLLSSSRRDLDDLPEVSYHQDGDRHLNRSYPAQGSDGADGANPMIKADGKEYATIADARSELGGVSQKTIRQWIDMGIIDQPPRIEWGLRYVSVFPSEYIAKAKEDLARYRKSRARNNQSSSGRR